MKITGEIEILPTPTQSPSDKKKYRLLKLQNGLKAYLVKHPEVEKTNPSEILLKDKTSAVALCVDVGSFDDPSEVQGLSHFLEHMVFMGSQKFPKENDFDQFIKSRNGMDNALTECEHTVFYFKIGDEHLARALERFAQFFVEPLMRIESMEREMEAVESEFQNSINDDNYRINQLFASMTLDYHPASKFTWGNLRTLKDGVKINDLHKIIHEFRRKFYKSNRMFLAVQSNWSLYEQQRLVTQYFSEIKPEYGTIYKKLSVDPSVDVFTTDFYKKMFFVKSKSKKRKMLMTFLLPTDEQEFKHKSLEYFAYLFNHAGRESLSSYLKRQSLVHQITAKVGGRSFECNSMFTFFTIDVGLTRDGYDCLESVVNAIFGYLFLIKMTPMKEHKEIYEEFRQIKEYLFKYRKEKSSIENVQELAVNMRYFKDEDTIIGNDLCPQFNERVMRRLIEKFNDRKFNLLVLSDNHQKYDKFEKWFGTEYAEVDFPLSFMRLWNERWIRKEFSLPWKNRYICKTFDILTDPEEACSTPTKIFKNTFCECFFKPDFKFKLPQGFVYVHFKSEMTEASVSNMNMTSIYSMCVKNFLTERLFSATVAGYNYKLNSGDDGLVLKLSGFNEKLPSLLDSILKALKNTDEIISKYSFDCFKKELKKNCYNYIINSNLFIEELRLNIIKPNHKFYFNRFNDVDKLSYMNFKEFVLVFLKSFRIKILVQGNFTKSQALDLTQLVVRHFDKEEIVAEYPAVVQTNQIPIGSNYLRVKSLLPRDKNSIIRNYYQIPVPSIESECLLELLVKVMREPLFNYLRTKEQIGYSVTCVNKKDDLSIGFTITVESQEKRHSAYAVDERIENFLKNFSEVLGDLDEDDFKMMKRSVIVQKLTPDTDLESEVIKNWNEVRDYSFQFDRNEIEARQLDLLRKEDLNIFFKDNFAPDSMRKLSTQILANADDDDLLLQHGFIHLDLISDDKHKTVKNIAQFKNSLATPMIFT